MNAEQWQQRAEEKEKSPFENKDYFDTKESFQKMIKGLREDIENGSIDLVLGEDASGRIPAIIIGEFIKTIYKKRGFPLKKRFFRFFAGGRGNDPIYKYQGKYYLQKEFYEQNQNACYLDAQQTKKEDVLLQMLKDLKEKEDVKKILIVTEYIEHGTSLQLIFELIKKVGLSVKCATMSIAEKPRGEGEEDRKNKLSKKFSIDPKDVIAGNNTIFVHQPTLSGVQKDRSKPFAEPVRFFDKQNKKGQEKIKTSYKDAFRMIKELVAWYETSDWSGEDAERTLKKEETIITPQ